MIVAACALAGCRSKDDEPPPRAQLPEGVQVFAFGVDPGQTISLAPFPNDLYRGPNGVTLAPLGSDPRYATLAKSKVLAMLDGAIAGRPGFGFAQPIQLFASQPVDLASLAGRVHLVAMDGPEKGREVALEAWWSPTASALSFFPAPGDWLMPDTRYVLALDAGVTTDKGERIGAPAALGDMLAATAPSGAEVAWERAGPLRSWVAKRPVPVIATTFRTEPSLPPLQAMLATVAVAKLESPTRASRYDAKAGKMIDGPSVTGADLDGYFGVPASPFENNPGSWHSGSRSSAAVIGGKPYQGGTYRGKIAKVVHGSVVVPAFNVAASGMNIAAAPLTIENGKAVAKLSAVVPITLYLCEPHLKSAASLPVAVFTHGGSATRNDATPLAVMNCQLGIATIASDLPFHGGRGETVLVGDRVLPTRIDELNTLTGLKLGDAGFVGDGVGDALGADVTVGNLFGLEASFSPAIIEANLLTISAELAALVRIVREGNWSALHDGLSFDAKAIHLESLSFGSTFTTGYLALSDEWRGAIGSSGSGHVLSANLTVAPNNANLASNIVAGLLGLKTTAAELGEGAYRDPVVGLLSWLAERGDSMAFAPYVLRHRQGKAARSIVHSSNSWDETLSSMSQLRYNAAMGFEVLEVDGFKIDSTIPGSDKLTAKSAAAKTTANVAFDGVNHTAALFYYGESCHAELITPICSKGYKKQYPPVVALDAKDVKVSLSPICALHAQGIAFLQSLAGGAGVGSIAPPAGDCAAVYGK
jgi:hypothetical protein